MTPKRTAIFISGRGSNMAALIEAAGAPGYPARPVLVVSNRPDAEGLDYAARKGVPTCAVDHRAYARRSGFEAEIERTLLDAGVEFIALAGFMRVLTPGFVHKWSGSLINIHPSLLPRHPGLDTHARAIAAGDRVHGCTVHHVVAEVDAGAVIGRAGVLVRQGDTPEELSTRVLRAEHLLYPRCLAAAVLGRTLIHREIFAADSDPIYVEAP